MTHATVTIAPGKTYAGWTFGDQVPGPVLRVVQGDTIDFTLINQWAGIGTLCVSSSDETTRAGDLVMRHVEKAQTRREELRRLVDTARQKRRVREIDMVHEDI